MNKKGELYCYGCGVKLQFKNPNKTGYISQNAFENVVHPLCERCYNIKFHNKLKDYKDIRFGVSEVRQRLSHDKRLIVRFRLSMFEERTLVCSAYFLFIESK